MQDSMSRFEINHFLRLLKKLRSFVTLSIRKCLFFSLVKNTQNAYEISLLEAFSTNPIVN